MISSHFLHFLPSLLSFFIVPFFAFLPLHYPSLLLNFHHFFHLYRTIFRTCILFPRLHFSSISSVSGSVAAIVLLNSIDVGLETVHTDGLQDWDAVKVHHTIQYCTTQHTAPHIPTQKNTAQYRITPKYTSLHYTPQYSTQHHTTRYYTT